MFKSRLNFALSLIKKNITYYVVIAVAVIVSITACAVKGCTAGILASIILWLLAWIGTDVMVYHNYIHGSDDED